VNSAAKSYGGARLLLLTCTRSEDSDRSALTSLLEPDCRAGMATVDSTGTAVFGILSPGLQWRRGTTYSQAVRIKNRHAVHVLSIPCSNSRGNYALLFLEEIFSWLP